MPDDIHITLSNATVEFGFFDDDSAVAQTAAVGARGVGIVAQHPGNMGQHVAVHINRMVGDPAAMRRFEQAMRHAGLDPVRVRIISTDPSSAATTLEMNAVCLDEWQIMDDNPVNAISASVSFSGMLLTPAGGATCLSLSARQMELHLGGDQPYEPPADQMRVTARQVQEYFDQTEAVFDQAVSMFVRDVRIAEYRRADGSAEWRLRLWVDDDAGLANYFVSWCGRTHVVSSLSFHIHKGEDCVFDATNVTPLDVELGAGDDEVIINLTDATIDGSDDVRSPRDELTVVDVIGESLVATPGNGANGSVPVSHAHVNLSQRGIGDLPWDVRLDLDPDLTDAEVDDCLIVLGTSLIGISCHGASQPLLLSFRGVQRLPPGQDADTGLRCLRLQAADVVLYPVGDDVEPQEADYENIGHAVGRDAGLARIELDGAEDGVNIGYSTVDDVVFTDTEGGPHALREYLLRVLRHDDELRQVVRDIMNEGGSTPRTIDPNTTPAGGERPPTRHIRMPERGSHGEENAD